MTEALFPDCNGIPFWGKTNLGLEDFLKMMQTLEAAAIMAKAGTDKVVHGDDSIAEW